MQLVSRLVLLILVGCSPQAAEITKKIDPNAPAKKIDWKVLRDLDVDSNKIKKGPLKQFINSKISIAGFAIPLEFKDKKVTEFLLSPYYPSCAHVPPPPPNQAILIKLKEGTSYESLYMPIQTSGILKLLKGSRVDTGFLMESPKIEPMKTN